MRCMVYRFTAFFGFRGLTFKIKDMSDLKNVNRPGMDTHVNNIIRVVPVDLSSGDFEDDKPFFIRVETEGVLRYCPWGNEDNEYIEKTFEASNIFVDPEACRKIFNLGQVSPSQASEVYVGYGV